MTKLWWAIIAQIAAAILAFFQLQGHYVWPKVKLLSSLWWIYGTSIIIAPLFFIVLNGRMNILEHFGI